MTPESHFSQADLLDFLVNVEKIGVPIWLDGGWAVDALLHEQTRLHSDVDIVVEKRHVAGLRQFLESQGYIDVPRDDTSDFNFVLGDQTGHLVDFHVIELDSDGNGRYSAAAIYPAASLTGLGKIGYREVRCISVEWLIQFHTGYPLRQSDYHDVTRLCAKFDLPLPEQYRDAAP